MMNDECGMMNAEIWGCLLRSFIIPRRRMKTKQHIDKKDRVLVVEDGLGDAWAKKHKLREVEDVA